MKIAPVADVLRGTAILLRGLTGFIMPLSCLASAEVDDDARLIALRQTIWRLRRAYEDATRDDGETLHVIISRFSALFGDVAKVFPLWVDLVEALTQDAERRFGGGPGLGAYKAAQVKAAVDYLMSRTMGPSMRLSLDPAVVSAVIDFTVDFVVMLLNRRGLWTPGEPAGQGVKFAARWWHWLIKQLLTIFARIHAWLEPRATLSADVRAEIDKLLALRAGNPFVVARDAVDLVRFMAAHRQQLAALTEIVATACSEAEHFLEMSGEEKQVYARDLVLVFLEDEYGVPIGGAVSNIVAFVVDRLIDAVVLIFNKRGVFSGPRPSSTGDALAPGSAALPRATEE